MYQTIIHIIERIHIKIRLNGRFLHSGQVIVYKNGKDPDQVSHSIFF